MCIHCLMYMHLHVHVHVKLCKIALKIIICVSCQSGLHLIILSEWLPARPASGAGLIIRPFWVNKLHVFCMRPHHASPSPPFLVPHINLSSDGVMWPLAPMVECFICVAWSSIKEMDSVLWRSKVAFMPLLSAGSEPPCRGWMFWLKSKLNKEQYLVRVTK